MRVVLALVLATALGPTLSATDDDSGFATADDFDLFVSHYYQKPEPERLVPSLRYMAELGLSAAEAPDRSGLVAFYGTVLRQDPTPATSRLQELSALAERSQEVLWQALWFAGTPEARSLLEALGPDPKSSRRGRWEDLRKAVPPDPLTMEIADPGVLDVLWGSFFATGDPRFVLRVIGALALARSEHDAQKIRIGVSAETSLMSNARRHPKVLEICRARLPKEPKAVRKALEQVVGRAAAP